MGVSPAALFSDDPTADVAVPLVSRSSQPQRVPALIAASTSAVTGTVRAPGDDGTKVVVAVDPIVSPPSPFQFRVDELQLGVDGEERDRVVRLRRHGQRQRRAVRAGGGGEAAAAEVEADEGVVLRAGDAADRQVRRRSRPTCSSGRPAARTCRRQSSTSGCTSPWSGSGSRRGVGSSRARGSPHRPRRAKCR